MHLQFILKDIIDLLVLWFILYRGILLFAETRALRLAYGIAVLIVVYFVARKFNLTGLLGLFSTFDFVSIGVVVLAILFAPEIREALARLGTGARARFREQRAEEKKVIDEVVRASHALAKAKVGALIVIQREDGLEDYIRSGVSLDSQVSAPLLESIFQHSSPLHDGAIVIKGNRVIAAKCILPLSEALELKRAGVGTRHRAAQGLAEQRDAAVIVVSEERGTVSLAAQGKTLRFLEEKRLSSEVMALFAAGMKRAQKREGFDIRKALFSNVHWKLAALVLSLVIWAVQDQELSVRATIAFDPKEYKIQDGATVVLDPAEMENMPLTLQGRNYQLYTLIYGLIGSESTLDGRVRLNDIPRKVEEVPSRKLSVRHSPVKVREQVTLHKVESVETDPDNHARVSLRRICGLRHLDDPETRTRTIFLHVATIAAIPKASVKVLVDGKALLPAEYKVLDAIIEFENEQPLVCLEKDRQKVQKLITLCATDPRIDVSKFPISKDQDQYEAPPGTELVLPPGMDGIALNVRGKVLKGRIVIPIRAGEAPPLMAEAERIRDQAARDATDRETKAKEEMEEIDRLEDLVGGEGGELLKILDLGRLTSAKNRRSDCEKEIKQGQESLEQVRESMKPENMEKVEKRHRELLARIWTQAEQHLERYIDSTAKWSDRLEKWVTVLDGLLQPVLEEESKVRAKDLEIAAEEKALEDGEDRAGQASQLPPYEDLGTALEARMDSIRKLRPDPVDRLEDVAALFPSKDHSHAWRELDSVLRSLAGTAKEMQHQIQTVSQKLAEKEEAQFPAHAEQKLLYAQKEAKLLELKYKTAGYELIVAEALFKQSHDSGVDERALLGEMLDGLATRVDSWTPSSDPAAERMAALQQGLEDALNQTEGARDQVLDDINGVDADLVELEKDEGTGEGPPGNGEDPADPETEASDKDKAARKREEATREYRGYEKDALDVLRERLDARNRNLGGDLGLIIKAKEIARQLFRKIEAASSPGSPPKAPEEPGKRPPSQPPTGEESPGRPPQQKP